MVINVHHSRTKLAWFPVCFSAVAIALIDFAHPDHFHPVALITSLLLVSCSRFCGLIAAFMCAMALHIVPPLSFRLGLWLVGAYNTDM